MSTLADVPPPPSGVYTPAQIRHAYGVDQTFLTTPTGSEIPGDGSGQTIAIIEQGDDPKVVDDLDVFDTKFGLTSSGPTLFQQYGKASSFLTVHRPPFSRNQGQNLFPLD